MPPPTCRPPGKADVAAMAVFLLASSAPSIMTCPPDRLSSLYMAAKSCDGRSVSKFVTGSPGKDNLFDFAFVDVYAWPELNCPRRRRLRVTTVAACSVAETALYQPPGRRGLK
mmetsp:Transcript_35264/g.99835  ORF Transcript_35264/g.99835 Transcript_35264/m.99835 type:complete len:113 (+) Transcript_35264:811-1149(+)